MLAAAIAAGAVALARSGEEVELGGPFEDEEGSTATGAPVDLESPYSWGVVHIENKGEDDAALDAVTLVDKPDPMRILGMYALPLGSPKRIGLIEGFDRRLSIPLRNLTIDAGESYQLVVGFEITEPGRYLVSGVRVRYHVGGQVYETVLPHALRACGPKLRYKRCPVETPIP